MLLRMKKPILLTAVGAALFAAGYWAGNSRISADSTDAKPGPVAAAAAARAAEASAKSGGALSEKEVRAFTAGRPFAKGGAKAWLLALATQLGGEHRGIEIEMVDMAQIFMTMDESCASETCDALVELLALFKAGDPALKAINDGDDMAEGAFMLTVFRLSQINPAAALEALRKMPEGIPDEATKLVFSRLAGQSQARAEEMVGTLPEKQRGDALEGIFQTLAGKDPVAALAFAEKYPEQINGYELNRALESMIKRDPQQGMAAAVKISGKAPDSEAVRHAFNTWLEKDQNAAMAWAGQHTGPEQDAVQSLLIEKRTESDPAGAMQDFARLEQTATNKADMESAAAAIASQLAEKDPASAQAWIATLTDGPHKDRASGRLADIWIREDPAAASEWIKNLPANGVRDTAAQRLAETISRRDPAAAFEWAGSIRDEDRRREAVENVMEVWRQQDPEAAKAAEASAGQSSVPTAGDK